MKDISIVIPVYNAAATLEELFSRLQKVLGELNLNGEVLFVDDGSKDKSWEKIKKIKRDHPETVTAIKLDRNFGQHHALFCGLTFSSGKLIITMDDDLQHPPEEIPKLLNCYNEKKSQVVYGVYRDKQHSTFRSAGSRFVQQTSRIFSDNTFGGGSSFRLLSRELVDKLKQEHQSFIFLDEIIYWFTNDVTGVEVEHQPRKKGKSGYGTFKLLGLYYNLIINYTALPLKLMTIVGVILSLISFALGIWFIIKKIYFNITVPGYTSLIVAILFSTSLMLISFGIIGKYLYQIFQRQNGKPPYSIREIL